MSFVPGSVLWRLTHFQRLHNQEVQNLYHFQNKTEIVDEQDLIDHTNALPGEFAGAPTDNLRIFQSSQLSWTKLVINTIVPHLGPVSEAIFESTTGAQANDSLPSYCAAVVTLRSAFAGRSAHGRLYIAGVPEDLSSQSQLDGTHYATLQQWCDDMRDWFNPLTGSQRYEWMLYSRKVGRHGLPIDSMLGAIRLQSVLARRNLGTQRHRLLGHGN